jgi:hypothetical protein
MWMYLKVDFWKATKVACYLEDQIRSRYIQNEFLKSHKSGILWNVLRSNGRYIQNGCKMLCSCMNTIYEYSYHTFLHIIHVPILHIGHLCDHTLTIPNCATPLCAFGINWKALNQVVSMLVVSQFLDSKSYWILNDFSSLVIN